MMDQAIRNDARDSMIATGCNENQVHNNNNSKPLEDQIDTHRYRFVATGVVANARLSPLLPADWVDITSTRSSRNPLQTKTTGANTKSNNTGSTESTATKKAIPDFLWENAPRHDTKAIRDDVKVYSHLPNGINILDSKWVLGRLFANDDDDDENDSGNDPLLATCKTHCFSGPEGFRAFARSVKLLAGRSDGETQQHDHPQTQKQSNQQELKEIIRNLPDIAKSPNGPSTALHNTISASLVERPPTDVLNWWVVKDAGANGAGGVWVVGPENATSFASPESSPMVASHKYVAQQYVWPPVLYDRKKCHVRVYVAVTCDGRAFVHRRAFLHVANEAFAVDEDDGDDGSGNLDSNSNSKNNSNAFDDTIHITNCCANSHDDTKFAGEILADFGEKDYTTWHDDNESDGANQQPVVPLADFFPSVQATVSQIVQRTFGRGLLDGGHKNHGFEYCGMDFMLSYKMRTPKNGGPPIVQPVAYLLEINSPPSQDTASSLPHAEGLHNEVLRDWMTFWVIPHIDSKHPVRPGGWIDCGVKHEPSSKTRTTNASTNNTMDPAEMVLPSKAAMLNKFRWALFERKVQKKESMKVESDKNSNATTKNSEDDKGTQPQKRDGIDVNGDRACRNDSDAPSAIEISRFARSQFPFFSTHSCFDENSDDIDDVSGDAQNSSRHSTVATQQRQQQQQQESPARQQIFFENAGGAQVPRAVIDHVAASLTRRHRDKIGSETKAAARKTLRRLLVGGAENDNNQSSSVVILGLNATSLLASLAQRYAKLLTPADEVVISTENHLANFDPWIEAAETAGATIKLWAPFSNEPRAAACGDRYETASNLHDLVTPQTRIVALPHASNVLGSVRSIADLSKTIKDRSNGYAHVVVDGVAVAPHEFVGFDDESFGGNVDWYVVSMHKLFGPHIGVLLARQNRSLDELLETAVDASSPANNHKTKEERIQALLESGTANIEGCAGVVGLGMYFQSLAKWYRSKVSGSDDEAEKCCTNETAETISLKDARLAYSMIRNVEVSLVQLLLRGLSRCPQVRVLDGSRLDEGSSETKERFRLPTVSFVHNTISSRAIYTFCQQRGIICRNGFFLCTKYLAADLNFDDHQEGVLRVSLAHYNTPREVQTLCDTLEGMPNWFSDDL